MIKYVISIAFLALIAMQAVIMREQMIFMDYKSKPASEKMNILWSEIEKDPTPAPFFGLLETFLGLIGENLKISFNYYSDIMPEGRKKYIHTSGSIAKARFVVDTSFDGASYTGLFATGCDNVLLRLSSAIAPSLDSEPTITPGLSIKFLRDGVDSGNLFAMYSLDGQNSWNFFDNSASNHIDPPKSIPLKILSKRFHMANKHETMIGVRDMAEYEATGVSVGSPAFPFRLFFEPSEDVKDEVEGKIDLFKGDKWRDQFKVVKPGTILYKVYIQSDPSTDQKSYYGYLETTSDFVESSFADTTLFFRHEGMDRDFEIYPEWKSEL